MSGSVAGGSRVHKEFANLSDHCRLSDRPEREIPQ
jgi:hypothetical protein